MVQEYQLKDLKITELLLDEENPNKVSAEQMDAMRHSMRKFGFLQPIIVDQSNRIADGEHRVQIYKEFGKETIPGFVVQCNTDTDRRLIRQTLNKLRGQHDPALDVKEFLKIYEAEGNLTELSKLLAKQEEELKLLLRSEDERQEDPNQSEDRLNSFLFGNIKQIVLYFDNVQYERALSKFDQIMRREGKETNTDVVLFLLDEYERTHG